MRRALRRPGSALSISLLSLVVAVVPVSPGVAPDPERGGRPDRLRTAGRWPRELPAIRGDSDSVDEQARAPERRPGLRPTGRLHTARGAGRVQGSGPLLRFTVEVEGGTGVRPSAFARRVEAILFSPRGWTRGDVSFQRVGALPADLRVILASPSLTDRLCAPALTRGMFSCHNDGRVVINLWRWHNGARAYRGSLERYRTYVVNHEVGHALGRGHVGCPAAGARAPVMMQQTIGVAGCRASPWPARYELP